MNLSSITRRALSAPSVVLFGLAGAVASPEAAAERRLAPQLGAAAPRPATPETAVRVEAREYAFVMPDTIAGGLVTLRLVNRGHAPHYLRLMRIDSGRTLADFAAWRRARLPRPAWLSPSGGAGTVAPGDSIDYTAALRPGRYVALCSHPDPDGSFHIDKGMLREVEVVERAARTRSERPPRTNRELVLREHSFVLSAPVASGRQAWRVRNVDAVPHQALLVRLPRGVTAEDELSWFRNGYRGERPAVPSGGIIELLPGEQAWFAATLPAGDYLLFCAQRDPAGRAHFDSGMIARFTVR